MEKKELLEIIRERIYVPNTESNYIGFNMSGFGTANYRNFDILNKFEDLLLKSESFNDLYLIFPHFWKGSGQLLKIDTFGKTEIINKDISGFSSEQIILETIVAQNPDILDKE